MTFVHRFDCAHPIFTENVVQDGDYTGKSKFRWDHARALEVSGFNSIVLRFFLVGTHIRMDFDDNEFDYFVFVETDRKPELLFSRTESVGTDFSSDWLIAAERCCHVRGARSGGATRGSKFRPSSFVMR